VLAAARAISGAKGADAVILLDEQRYSIDAKGRITTTLRKVYRVLTTDGVEDWSAIAHGYAPWHERKPELRARVITADGSTHWLDPNTITDAPALEFETSIFSDRRMLQAPLPAVAADSVVEYEMVARETAPALDAGSLRRIDVWDATKIQRLHLVVDAAARVPLKALSQLIPTEAIRRTETKAGVHIECDWGPIDAKKDWEPSVPFDTAGHPVFEFSTGRSWQDLAAQYGAIVDSRIGPAGLSGFGDPPQPGESTAATAARLVAALHKQVRYTGLELGDAAVVPVAPSDVLVRRYGDCKDKATLLVAALRAAGLKANVALLSTGFGLDVNPALPGFGLFNHAIVYIDAPDPLWIDATAQYTRVGELPAQDQGRLALIATGTTTSLVKTPESRAAQNRSMHTIDIRLAEFGHAEISESIESFGAAESEVRARFGGSEPAKVKETLERQAKEIYLAESLGDFTTTRGDDFSQPFRVTITAKNAARGVTEEDEAVAGLFSHFLFSDLPFGLAPLEGDGEAVEDKPRIHDFVISFPYQAEYRYRVFYPPFLKPKPLPKDERVQMGPATYSSSYRQDAAGYVEAVFRFDAGKRRFTPAEYAELRGALRRVWNQKPEMLSFSSATSEALALGKAGEAVRLAREYTAKQPGSAAQARLSRVLIAVGAGDSAASAAKRAVELDPQSTQAWQALGWAHQHDSFGRRFRGNWSAAEAEKAYRKAIDATSDNLVPWTDLAIVLEHNSNGDRYGQGSRLNEAIDTYRTILKKGANGFVQRNLAIALLYAGKYEEAAAELKKLPAAGNRAALWMIVTALTQGADRAILNAQSDLPDPTTRAAELVSAAVSLALMRQYDLATEFLKAARRINHSPDVETRIAALSHVKRSEQVQYPADDPRAVVQRLYFVVFAGTVDEAHLRPIVSKRETFSKSEDTAEKQVRRLLAGIQGRFRSLGFSASGVLDVVLSALELEKEGDDTLGYRVRGKASLGAIPAAYVIKEDGEYRLLATADSLENVGKLVLDLVRSNDLEPARRWLDLVINGVFVSQGKAATEVSINALGAGPGGDDSPAAKFLWAGLTEKGRTAAAIRTTAASLVGTFSVSEEAIRILKQERLAATNRLDRGNIDLALCQAYKKAGKWTELLAAAKELPASYAVADKSFDFLVKARTGLQQWAELEQDARTELKTSPQKLGALRAAALAMMRAGKPEKATEYIDQIRKLQFSGKAEHTLEAWHALLLGKADDLLIEKLEQDRGLESMEPDIEYILGFLQAQSGKTEEARRLLVDALELDDWALLDTRPWVLQGKVQEQLGNADAAAAAYAEAKKRSAEGDDSAWALKLVPAATKP